MKAGFALEKITPAIGCYMVGYPHRDAGGVCQSIHDDLFVRALVLEQNGNRVAIVSHDLLFFDRRDVAIMKKSIEASCGLSPSNVLMNASHTHSGPNTSTWLLGAYTNAPDPVYMQRVLEATISAIRSAIARLVAVTIEAGRTETDLPVSRRKLDAQGKAQWAPDPSVPVNRALPVFLLRRVDDRRAVACVYSVACHPSTTNGYAITADYPGVSNRLLDEHLGSTCSMMLQGCAGDTKASVIADGGNGTYWRNGTWDDIERAGRIVAERVIDVLKNGLAAVKPDLRCSAREIHLPLEEPLPREELVRLAGLRDHPAKHLWAQAMLERLSRDEALPTHATITAHALRIGQGLRVFAVEGEPVASWGQRIEQAAGSGITFALGYTNGQGLYIPTESMLAEGGYEVDSAWEYGFPSQLRQGFARVIDDAVAKFRVDEVL